MKTTISFMTIMMLTLSFGAAFADEWPTDKSHLFLGTELRDEVLPAQKAEVIQSGAMGAAAGGMRLDKSVEILDSLLGNYESTDVVDPYRAFGKHETVGAMGVAAGGLRGGDPDKGGRIFETLFGSRGSETDIAH